MATLYDRIAATAAQAPDAPALTVTGSGAEQTFTRRAFIGVADALADRWAAQGLGQGDFIGWLGHNSAEMLAAPLACARLGAVFVPLNWRLAAAELAAIARHAGLSVLDGTPELAGLADVVRDLAPPLGPLVRRRGEAAEAEAVDGAAATGAAQPGDAMLVYTSGTTGLPKGAMHTQAGMLANVEAALAVQPISVDSRVLAILPLFHVGGLCIQTLPALAAGAQVRLHARFDPAAWLNDVAVWRATTSLLVPAVMRAIVEHADFAGADLSSLRFLNSGSQVVPVGFIEAFHARGVPVSQVYGSTETGPVSIALDPAEAMAAVGTVGRPAPGVTVRLVAERAAGATGANGASGATGGVGDGDSRRPLSEVPEVPACPEVVEVPPGEVGEIWLRADNLMRGYHREPDHPACAGGWFRTGDLARRLPNGHIEVVGRSKDLIISGGENIYPAEIENLLADWPGLAECAVVPVPDARWGEVPVLVITMAQGRALDRDALQARFDQRLARFKHPRHVVERADLPRTALGKVQKAELARALTRELAAS